MHDVMIGCSAPFGWLVGWLSSINRTLPFVFNIVVFVVCILLVLLSKTLKRHDDAGLGMESE